MTCLRTIVITINFNTDSATVVNISNNQLSQISNKKLTQTNYNLIQSLFLFCFIADKYQANSL